MPTGLVAAFDELRGYGTIRAADGTDVFFHCTRLVDGSRTVDVGTAVAFDLVPGHHGRREAAAITKG